MKICGIYKITNLVNGKCYIGQAKDCYDRFSEHRSASRCPKDKAYNFNIHKAMRKYGINNFSFEIIEKCSKEELNEKEQYWVSYFDSYRNGYNSTIGGQAIYSELISKEHILKSTKILEELNKNQKNENHPRAKLTKEQVIDIRTRYINGEKINTIYQDYQSIYPNYQCFKNVCTGRSYKTIYPIPSKEDIQKHEKENAGINSKQKNFSKEDVLYIRNNPDKLSKTALSQKFNCSATTIYKIINFETYKNIK